MGLCDLRSLNLIVLQYVLVDHIVMRDVELINETGLETGCIHRKFKCYRCGLLSGKLFIMTNRKLDPLRNNFCLHRDSVTEYKVNYRLLDYNKKRVDSMIQIY